MNSTCPIEDLFPVKVLINQSWNPGSFAFFSYRTLNTHSKTITDVEWFYFETKRLAEVIKGRIMFWKDARKIIIKAYDYPYGLTRKFNLNTWPRNSKCGNAPASNSWYNCYQ